MGNAYTANTLCSHSSYLLQIKFNLQHHFEHFFFLKFFSPLQSFLFEEAIFTTYNTHVYKQIKW